MGLYVGKIRGDSKEHAKGSIRMGLIAAFPCLTVHDQAYTIHYQVTGGTQVTASMPRAAGI